MGISNFPTSISHDWFRDASSEFSYVTGMILQVMNLIGDVRGKVAVMVDDMIDTAG